jgi:hypothetical protein
MKRILMVIAIVGLLVAGFAIPAYAHGTDGEESIATNQETWETMMEACETGDWEAMVEVAEEVHGRGLGYMPHYSDYYAPEEGDRNPANRWCGMGGHTDRDMMGEEIDDHMDVDMMRDEMSDHMVGGMMSGGWGGMMGWH